VTTVQPNTSPPSHSPRRPLPKAWWMLAVGTIAAAASAFLPLGYGERATFLAQEPNVYGAAPLIVGIPAVIALVAAVMVRRRRRAGDWWTLPLLGGGWMLPLLLLSRFGWKDSNAGFEDGPGMIGGLISGALLAYSSLLLWNWGREVHLAEQGDSANSSSQASREPRQTILLGILAVVAVAGAIGAVLPLSRGGSYPLDFVARANGPVLALIAIVAIARRGSVGDLWALLLTIGALLSAYYLLWGSTTFVGPYAHGVGAGFIVSLASNAALTMGAIVLAVRAWRHARSRVS
jgi:hypothetical protein